MSSTAGSIRASDQLWLCQNTTDGPQTRHAFGRRQTWSWQSLCRLRRPISSNQSPATRLQFLISLNTGFLALVFVVTMRILFSFCKDMIVISICNPGTVWFRFFCALLGECFISLLQSKLDSRKRSSKRRVYTPLQHYIHFLLFRLNMLSGKVNEYHISMTALFFGSYLRDIL